MTEIFAIAAGVLIAEAVIAAFRYAWRITFVRHTTRLGISQADIKEFEQYRRILGDIGKGAGRPLGAGEREAEAETNRVRPDGH